MNEFVDSLHEVLGVLGTINARRMFGGYGIFHDGLMFALVADDELYLKADAQSASEFEALGLPAFRYQKRGKAMQMSYYRAPEAIFDDPVQARLWADKAYEAALRARHATTAGSGRAKRPDKDS